MKKVEIGMKMMNLTKVLAGVAALSMLTVLVGCDDDVAGAGGGGGAPAPVNVNGNTPVQVAGAPAAAVAADAVGAFGAAGNAVAGVAVGAGVNAAVIPAGVKILPGLNGGRAAGDIRVNGVLLNSIFVVGGALSSSLALPPGTYTIVLSGPFTITDGQGDSLTAQQLSFTGTIGNAADGFPLPLSIQGTLPSNGSNVATSNVVATFKAAFNGRTGTLSYNFQGGQRAQSKVIAGGSATFSDTQDGPTLPGTGVNNIQFTVN